MKCGLFFIGHGLCAVFVRSCVVLALSLNLSGISLAEGAGKSQPQTTAISETDRIAHLQQVANQNGSVPPADLDWLLSELTSAQFLKGEETERERMPILLTLVAATVQPIDANTADRICTATYPFLTGYPREDIIAAATIAGNVKSEKAIPRLRHLSEGPDRLISQSAHDILTTMGFRIVIAAKKPGEPPFASMPPDDLKRINAITDIPLKKGDQPSRSDFEWLLQKLADSRLTGEARRGQQVKVLNSMVLATSRGVQSKGVARKIYRAASPFLTGHGVEETCAACIIAAQLDEKQAIPQLLLLANGRSPIIKRSARYALLRIGVTRVLSADAAKCRNNVPLPTRKVWSYAVYHPREILTTRREVFFAGEDSVGALNASDGRLLWKKSLDESTMYPQIATNHNILLVSLSTRIAAFSARTGERIWNMRVRNPYALPITIVDQSAFLQDGPSSICMIDIRTGKPRWKRKILTTAEEKAHGSVTLDDKPIVNADRVYLVMSNNAADKWQTQYYVTLCLSRQGDIVWKNGGSRDRLYLFEAQLLDHILTIATNYGLLAVDSNTGRPIWHTSKFARWLLSARRKLIAVSNRDMTAIDPKMGRQAWTMTAPPCRMFWAFISDGQLMLTADSKIMALDKDGRLQSAGELGLYHVMYAFPIHDGAMIATPVNIIRFANSRGASIDLDSARNVHSVDDRWAP